MRQTTIEIGTNDFVPYRQKSLCIKLDIFFQIICSSLSECVVLPNYRAEQIRVLVSFLSAYLKKNNSWCYPSHQIFARQHLTEQNRSRSRTRIREVVNSHLCPKTKPIDKNSSKESRIYVAEERKQYLKYIYIKKVLFVIRKLANSKLNI